MNVCQRYPALESPGQEALPPKLIETFVAPVPELTDSEAVPLFVALDAVSLRKKGRDTAVKMTAAKPAIVFLFRKFIRRPLLETRQKRASECGGAAGANR